MLAAGGARLAGLGGSLYYVVIGLCLLAAGVLTFIGQVGGLYVYILAFIITLIWSLWEAGLDGWALVPRLVGPFILLVLAVLVMPPRLPGGGRKTLRLQSAAFAVIVALGLAIAVPLAKTDVAPLPLPAAKASTVYFGDETAPAAAHSMLTPAGDYLIAYALP